MSYSTSDQSFDPMLLVDYESLKNKNYEEVREIVREWGNEGVAIFWLNGGLEEYDSVASYLFENGYSQILMEEWVFQNKEHAVLWLDKQIKNGKFKEYITEESARTLSNLMLYSAKYAPWYQKIEDGDFYKLLLKQRLEDRDRMEVEKFGVLKSKNAFSMDEKCAMFTKWLEHENRRPTDKRELLLRYVENDPELLIGLVERGCVNHRLVASLITELKEKEFESNRFHLNGSFFLNTMAVFSNEKVLDVFLQSKAAKTRMKSFLHDIWGDFATCLSVQLGGAKVQPLVEHNKDKEAMLTLFKWGVKNELITPKEIVVYFETCLSGFNSFDMVKNHFELVALNREGVIGQNRKRSL